MKAHSSPPKSARILTQWVDRQARAEGRAPGRVRSWVSFVALAGALSRASTAQTGRPKFIVKGGVAMELRLGDRARATKDLDLIVDGDGADMLQELVAALQGTYEGFSFLIKGEPHRMPNGAVRAEVSLRYLGSSWDTVPVDISRREGDTFDVEFVSVTLLEEFGLQSPGSIPCLPLSEQIAQKIHALTEPQTPERPNHRFRDLVDLLLLRPRLQDLPPLREACQRVFSSRGTHPWPPFVEAHEHWIAPFGVMAESVGLPVRDLHQAVIEARELLHEIDAVSPRWRERRISRNLSATTWYYVVGTGEQLRRIPASLGERIVRRDLDGLSVPAEWQRGAGGVFLIAIVMLLENRTPTFVERAALRLVALNEELSGQAVLISPTIWDKLAQDLVRQAKSPSRALDALSEFLSSRHGPLPCELASQLGSSARWAHMYFAGLIQLPQAPIWDLQASEPIRWIE